MTVGTAASQGTRARTVLPKSQIGAIKTKIRLIKLVMAVEIRKTVTIAVMMGILTLSASESLKIPIIRNSKSLRAVKNQAMSRLFWWTLRLVLEGQSKL